MIKKILFLIFVTFVFLTFQASAQAETISVTVSDNGSESENTVNQQVSQTTTIEQSNTANISNNVDQNLNTGQNSTNQNTGDQSSVSTGDISTQTGITNNTNNNVVNNLDCGCDSSLIVENSNNGSDSQNTINSNVTNQTEITVSNWANVENNVNITANSGDNSASDNSWSVQIITGGITVTGKIANRGNNSLIEIDPANLGNISIFNRFNGSNSTNLLNIDIENLLNIFKYDFASVENNVDIIVNTGGNTADGNLGDVSITTGNIDINFAINNDFNHDVIRINPLPKGGLPPEPTGQPAQPAAPAGPSGPSAVSQAAAAAGEVLAAAALPVTGPTSFIFLVLLWLTLAGIGLFLRRVSGLSPPHFSILYNS